MIQSAWRSAVSSAALGGPSGIGGTCGALDPALWIFGKFGCSHCEQVGRRSPISSACLHCRYPGRGTNDDRMPPCRAAGTDEPAGGHGSAIRSNPDFFT